jgi:site-specific recombinase XerD
MSARKEVEQKEHEDMLRYLDEKPKYFTEFYYSIHDKSYCTKNKYVRYAVNFAKQEAAEGVIDYKDPTSFSKIRPATINEFISKQEGSSSFKRMWYYSLKAFFNYLDINDYIPTDPMVKIKPPKDKDQHEIIILTKEEIDQIFYNIDHPVGNSKALSKRLKYRNMYKAFMSLALVTGLRQSSIREINVQDIDWNEMCINVIQKGETQHTAYFDSKTAEYIQTWIQDREKILREKKIETDALFINQQGHRMVFHNVEEMLKIITWNLDKHITAHKLRATCCTTIIENTGDISLAAHVLGHSNLKNTMRYRKFTDESNEKALNAVSKLIK